MEGRSLLVLALALPAVRGYEAASEAAAACGLTVFSHRGLAGDPTIDVGPAPLPSEASLLALARRGVTAFDLDLCFSADAAEGEIVVAHPAALKAAYGIADVHTTSSADLRRTAAGRGGRLLTASRLLTLAERHNLTVALDLKGGDRQPAQHALQLYWLARRIQRTRGLASHVWLWAETAAVAKSLRGRLKPNAPALTLIRAIRDRGVRATSADGSLDCAASQLERVDASVFTRLGPSSKCANHELLAAEWARRWKAAELLVWVVDDAATLTRMLRHGVRNVVSNKPLNVRDIARTMCNQYLWSVGRRSGA